MKDQNPESAIVEHKVLYRGMIVDLHVDTIELPSGKRAIREVVRHPGGVVAMPVLQDGRVLLIRQFRYPLQKYILELPAGKLDCGLSPRDTAALEVEEETGYRAGRLDHEFSFYTTPGICDEVIHFFIARDLAPAETRHQEGEHITVEAHTVDECLRLIRSGEIADGKTILGILWHRLQEGPR
jgi:ADP-ribose pyrophosphatase